jgi:tetratricopeptide (TPR) repeat protein
LNKALGSLARRSILNYDRKDKTAYYKLHGLLADSIREQIDVTKQDYSKYIDNIKRVRETYNHFVFWEFVECIGNSLCEYEITTNISLLNTFAGIFDCYWKTDYAKKLYGKCIKITNQRLKTEPENIEYLENLASTYNNLALLQTEQLNDYHSAQNNFNNAIKIDKRIIKISDEPDYKDKLAWHYNDLASLQDDHLNDPKSAETTYNKAIEILKKITEPADNEKYLYALVRTYFNLANSQKNSQYDYDSAEENYNNAITIGEEIRGKKWKTKTLSNSIVLAMAYSNLAPLQMDQKKYESAIRNCTTALDIHSKVYDISLESFGNCMVSENLLARLYIATGKPSEAREIVNEIKPAVKKWLNEYPNYGYLQNVYKRIKKTERMLNK